VVAVRPRQVLPARRDLGAEGVVEVAARPPVEKADAEFPGGLGLAVEFPRVDAEPAVEGVGEGEGGRLADADDPQPAGADDVHRESGKLELEGDGSEEAGATASEYEDVVNHGTPAPRGDRPVLSTQYSVLSTQYPVQSLRPRYTATRPIRYNANETDPTLVS